MPRVEEGRVNSRRDVDLVLVAGRLEPLDRALGVLRGVQRLIEIDLEVRRLTAQVGLRVVRPAFLAATW